MTVAKNHRPAKLHPVGIYATSDPPTPSSPHTITSISYSSIGHLYTGSGDGSIQIWDLPLGKPLSEWHSQRWLYRVHAHTGGVVFLDVLPAHTRNESEQLVSIGAQGDVKLWELEQTGLACLKSFFGFHAIIHPSVVFSRALGGCDGAGTEEHRYLIFATEDGALNLWNLDDHSSVATLIDHVSGSLITELAVHGPENLLAIGTSSGVVMLWDLSTLMCVGTMQLEGVVTHLTFADGIDIDDNGSTLAAASSNGTTTGISVWQSVNGHCSLVFSHTGDIAIQEISVLGTGRFLVTYWDSVVATLDTTRHAKALHMEDETCRNIFNNNAMVSCSRVVTLDSPNEFLLVCGYTNAKIALFLGGKYGVLSPDSLPCRGKVCISVGDEARELKFHGAGPISLTAWKMTPGPELEAVSADGDPDEDEQCRYGEDSGVVHFLAAPDEFVTNLYKTRTALSPTEAETLQHNHRHLRSGTVMPWYWLPHFDPTDFATNSLVQHRMPLHHTDKAALAQALATEIHAKIVKNDITVTEETAKFTWPKLTAEERLAKYWEREGGMDTVAVAISDDGHDITIAANVKRRTIVGGDPWPHREGEPLPPMKFTSMIPADGYGLRKELHEQIIRNVLAEHPETHHSRVQVVTPTARPQDHKENAMDHAEMQLLAHSGGDGRRGQVPVLGVSKAPCAECRKVLNTKLALAHPLSAGLAAPKNWVKTASTSVQVADFDVTHGPVPAYKGNFVWGRTAVRLSEMGSKVVKIVSGEAVKINTVNLEQLHPAEPAAPTRKTKLTREENRANKRAAKSTPIIASKSKIKEPVISHAPASGVATKTLRVGSHVTYHKPNIKQIIRSPGKAFRSAAGRPRAAGGIGALIESVVENYDREGFAEATATPSAGTETYHTRSTFGVYASAGTVSARAGHDVCEVAVRGPNVAAGAHVGFSGLSVYAKAELARAEASILGASVGVGLNLSSGASIGFDGIDVSVLGAGVSLGPRISIRLPIGDVSCVII